MSANRSRRPNIVLSKSRSGITLSLLLMILLFAACQSNSSGSTESQPLQANAGADIAVKVGAAPVFDGCASTGAIANYQWKIVKAPETMAEYDGKVIREIDTNCSYTLEASMLVDEVGMWEVELEIKDAQGNTSTDNVKVEVEP